MSDTKSSKPKTFGRRIVDIGQKARGRTPLRYEFEIIPYFVGEIPPGHERVLFAWERGTKLFVTDPEAVNPNTRAVFWKQYLRQTITVYRAGGEIVPKEYAFKIQSVKENAAGEEERKTIGKTHVDLSQFCVGQTDPQPKEVFLQLKPHGKLKVSIKATWNKDAKIDADAMTEMSGPTEEYSEETGQYLEDLPYNEQDLSGFDPSHENGGGASSSGRGGRASSRSRDDRGSGDGEGSQEGGSSSRSGKKSSRSKSGHKSKSSSRDGSGGSSGNGRYAEEQGGSDLPRDPDEMRRIQEEEEQFEQHTQQDDEYHKLVAEITAQVRADVDYEPQSGSTFCCCFPRGGKRAVVDAQEVSTLLSKQQGVQMSHTGGGRG